VSLKLFKINSVEVNLLADTTAFWPMERGAKGDQSTNTIHENIQ